MKIGYARVSSKEQNLERLGRNNKELTELMNQIQQKGETLEVLNLPSMTGIEDDNLRRLINNLMIELYKYQAESERKRIKERQVQGIAIAGDLKDEKINILLKMKAYNMRLTYTDMG